MKEIVVIYHKADFDGIFCREIARRQFGDAAEYIGWDYGDPVPAVNPVFQLYILDLSIPELMNHPRLIWIDHHKSAIEKYDPEIAGYRIDGVAACRLAWQWFFCHRVARGGTLPEKAEYCDRRLIEPQAVTLAGEYDVWDKRDPNAETFQFALRSRELSAEDWEALFGDTVRFAGQPNLSDTIVQDLLRAGGLLQQYQQNQDASLMSRSFTLKFEGLTFLALNTARCNSLTFAAGVKPEHDALMGFYYDGQKTKVSLYHAPGKEQHDLSAIAVKYGGGGHRGACGFTAKHLCFLPGNQIAITD